MRKLPNSIKRGTTDISDKSKSINGFLEKSGFKVSDTAYFVYANASKDKEAFDAKLEFEITLVPYKGDASWVDGTLQDIHATLAERRAAQCHSRLRLLPLPRDCRPHADGSHHKTQTTGRSRCRSLMVHSGYETFRDKVRAIVKKIPKGKTMTYKEVAAKAGNSKAARAVGAIMRSNYDTSIPCHRVIRSDGSFGNYNRGGTLKKQAILEAEGAL
jgi:methylated-DNA-[protein]-cysteine S-methyltransferase